jgi:hypothetical protein
MPNEPSPNSGHRTRLAISLLGLLLAIAAATTLLRMPSAEISPTIPSLQTELRRDPASPYRWADLAEGFFESGDVPSAEKCFHRARLLGPHIPPIWIRDANFHFAIGRFQPALEASARVLATVPGYDAFLFTYFDRFIPDPVQVLSAIGPDRRAASAYFQHLLDIDAAQLADIAWDKLSERGFVDDKLASSYVGFLLCHRSYDRARDMWIAWLGPRRGDYPGRNLLFNGSYETEPTGSPFDWIIETSDKFDAVRDKSNARNGAWSVRIAFHGDASAAYETVRQTARVDPGPHRLLAWIRTQDITTTEGIRLRVFDPENPARLDYRTNSIVGSHGWSPIVELIEVPAQTNLVTVEVFRAPSAGVEGRISGSAWVNGVSLTRD